MADEVTEQVALLIDFENLVYGLAEQFDDRLTEVLEPELLFRLAEDSGQVVLANAYADWRFKDVNQFQTDLYRLGIELIHVFSKHYKARYKNAVDVKMAVDAVEILWTLPHIQTFVIVSGDRDFIHVLKTLRRYGKTIIGVSPAPSVSDDFASLCDRFVRYGHLAQTFTDSAGAVPISNAELPGLKPVSEALRSILAERKGGIKGAQVKPLLRRKLSASFDESEYGFSRLLDLLLALPDTVRVVYNPNGGDITVLPAAVDDEHTVVETLNSSSTVLLSKAGLKNYKFESDPAVRRAIIAALYDCMSAEQPFAWDHVYEVVLEKWEDLPISLSVLSKYQAILWQSRIFLVESDQQEKPQREKLMRLNPSVATVDDLIFRYEASVTYKLGIAANELGAVLEPSLLAEVLGIDLEEQEPYIRKLLDYNRQAKLE